LLDRSLSGSHRHIPIGDTSGFDAERDRTPQAMTWVSLVTGWTVTDIDYVGSSV
jgi:hypothetical protein